GRDVRPDAFRTDMFRLAEIDNKGRVVSFMKFEIDDLDTAITELDSRYLAGEAAPYADVWQAITEGLRPFNRRAPAAALWKVAVVDHRQVPFRSQDFEAATKELWTLVPDVRYRARAVLALDAHGAVIDHFVEGTDGQGNELQWATVNVMSLVS